MKLCALSVDLDGIGEYRGLYGLASRERQEHVVMDVALARALSFARDHRAPLSLFVIGQDLVRPRSAAAIRAAAKRGARVENHSWSHRYDLSRLPPSAIACEVSRASTGIADVTDRRPSGFRAPGYVLSPALLAAVRTCGMLFDASALPCPAYYATKLLAMAAIRIRGRQTRAVVDAFASQLRPRQPYFTAGLCEIPMAVTRRLRLPVIGTSIALAGAAGAPLLLRGCLGDPVVSLELHGIDFLDASDGLEDLARHQLDVRLPVAAKLSAFAVVMNTLRAAGYSFVGLDDMAAEMQCRRGGGAARSGAG